MNAPLSPWATIHPSAYRDAATLVRRAAATTRAHGALRYQCPVTGSFILITDEATLASLDRPLGRVRCVGCGEMHLLTHDDGISDAAAIVAQPARP
jgi:hypothetical protein